MAAQARCIPPTDRWLAEFVEQFAGATCLAGRRLPSWEEFDWLKSCTDEMTNPRTHGTALEGEIAFAREQLTRLGGRPLRHERGADAQGLPRRPGGGRALSGVPVEYFGLTISRQEEAWQFGTNYSHAIRR